jgi:head-tail adaptor
VSTFGYRVIVRAAPVGSIERPAAQQRFREDARIFTIEAVAEYDPEGRYLLCLVQEEQVV